MQAHDVSPSEVRAVLQHLLVSAPQPVAAQQLLEAAAEAAAGAVAAAEGAEDTAEQAALVTVAARAVASMEGFSPLVSVRSPFLPCVTQSWPSVA